MSIFRPLGSSLLAAAALLAAPLAQAQYDADEALRTWTEGEVPPPPSFSARNLVPVAQRPYATVQVGVDVDTITVGPDGVVRYVLVFQGKDGSRTARYQGVRCQTWESRTYANYEYAGQTPGWVTANTGWNSLHDAASRHANDLARKGLCDNLTPPVNSAEARKSVRLGKASWMGAPLGAGDAPR